MIQKLNNWVQEIDAKSFCPKPVYDDNWIFFGNENFRWGMLSSEFLFNDDEYKLVWIKDFETKHEKIFKSWTDKEETNQFKYFVFKKKEFLKSKYYSALIKKIGLKREDHPLLKKRHLQNNFLSAYNEYILLPFHNLSDSKISGVHIIRPDETTQNIGNIEGAYYQLSETIKEKIFICEDFFSANTVQKLTKQTIIISFSEANLIDVAIHFSKKFPFKKIYMCLKWKADVDKLIRDLKEILISEGCYNVIIGHPYFPTPLPGLSSFNDLYCQDESEGKTQVKLFTNSHINFMIPLGTMGNSLFFYSYKSGITKLKKLSIDELIKLCPFGYWEQMINVTSSRDWELLRKKILSIATEESYDYFQYRKMGIYEEGDDLIINTGKELINTPSGQYHYLMNSKNERAYLPKPGDVELNTAHLGELQFALKFLNFRDKWGSTILLSWLIFAPFFRACPFKVHLSIEGESSAGKGWMRSNVILPFLNWHLPQKYYGNDTTLPYFLREEQYRPRICLLEEKEKNTADNYIHQWLNAFRLSSTEPEAYSGKCDSGEGTLKYPYWSLFCLFSISPVVREVEDKNRFVICSLKNKRSKESYKYMRAIKRIDLNSISLGLYGQLFYRWKEFCNNREIFYESFLSSYMIGHAANKWAVICSIAKMFLLNPKELTKFIEWVINFQESEEPEDSGFAILNIAVSISWTTFPKRISVRDILLQAKPDIALLEKLRQSGVVIKYPNFYISRESIYINNYFSRDKETQDTWFFSLKEKFPTVRKRFATRKMLQAVEIPIEKVLSPQELERVNPDKLPF